LQQVWIKAQAKKDLAGSDKSRAGQQAIHSSNKYKNQDTKKKDSFRECFWFVSILLFFSILGSK
jgi:hypothetical protein